MHTELRLSVTGSLGPEYPNDFYAGEPVDLGESAPHCRELSHPHRGASKAEQPHNVTGAISIKICERGGEM